MKYKRTPKHPKKSSFGSRHSAPLPLLEIMAQRLTDYSQMKLPDGCLDGRLKGSEEDIRQEGIILALDWLNKHLRSGKPVSTWNYRRSLAIALRFARRRFLHRIKLSADTVSIDESNAASCDHPTQQDLTDWPSERMRKMASCAISMAYKDGKISKSNAAVAHLVYVRGIAVEDVASRLGVTRSAIYQQLGRIKRTIKPAIEQTEAPYEL